MPCFPSEIDFYADGTVIKGQYPNSRLDMLHEVDLVVGSIVGAFEDRLLMKDTIIIFASDNGGLRSLQNLSHRGPRVSMTWRYDGVFSENYLSILLDGMMLLRRSVRLLIWMSTYDSPSFVPYIASNDKTEGNREYLGTWAYNKRGEGRPKAK